MIEPTKIYVKSVLSLIKKFPVNAISHITGGGLIENIPRVLPKNLMAKLDSKSFQLPEIFKWLQVQGNIEMMEMYRVFNCGIGMIIVLPAEHSNNAIELLNSLGEKSWLIGEIAPTKDKQISI